MNKSQPPFNTVFNAPAEMVVRMLLLLGLAAAAVASALLVTGGFSHQLHLVFYGVLCLAFSATLLLWLRRSGRLDGASGAFEESISAMEGGNENLDALQRRLDVLEEKRGDASFDPWTALDLRRKIAKRQRQRVDPPD